MLVIFLVLFLYTVLLLAFIRFFRMIHQSDATIRGMLVQKRHTRLHHKRRQKRILSPAKA
ncbi:MAG: hypothetical protein AABZ41_01860 [Bacteroidota bacterium]